VVRAARILDAIAAGGPLAAAALARQLGLRPSSVADLCGSLVEEGMIRRRSDGTFVLGARIESWGAALLRQPQVFRLFGSAVGAEVRLEGLTVTLDGLQGAEVLCVASRLGALPLPSTPRPGTRTAPLGSAAGRAILLAGPEADIDRHFERYSGHQSLPQGQAARLRAEARIGPEEVWVTAEGTVQIAEVVPDIHGAPTLSAVVLHLPSSFSDGEALRTAREALRDLAARLAGAL
jgi:DNA-binding IclR family transcriptional regulator